MEYVRHRGSLPSLSPSVDFNIVSFLHPPVASHPSIRSNRGRSELFYFALFYFALDSRPFSAQTLAESPSQRGRARFGSVVCTAHRHCVAARLLPTRKFSSSTAAKQLARCAPPSCELTQLRCMKLKRSPQRDFCGDPMSTISSCSTFADTPRRKRWNSTVR